MNPVHRTVHNKYLLNMAMKLACLKNATITLDRYYCINATLTPHAALTQLTQLIASYTTHTRQNSICVRFFDLNVNAFVPT